MAKPTARKTVPTVTFAEATGDPAVPVEGDTITGAEPLEPFTGFDEAAAPEQHIDVDVELQKRLDAEMEEVAIIPRTTVMRTRIGDDWYNFVKGKEVLVPRHVATWLQEKGIL
jgi:hypothetical protein